MFKMTHGLSIQPFHRRVFAFRRYSVEEDGRLVARTRNAIHDLYASSISYRAYVSTDIANISRHKPYERTSRPVAILQSNNGDVPHSPREGPPRKKVDGATMSRLFQQLFPLTVDPSSFESNAAGICAAFDLDPATSSEIISSFKERLPADKSQGSTCACGSFCRFSPLTPHSSPSTTGGPPIPEHQPTSAPTPISVPVRHQRPFVSGPKGHTVWYATTSSLSLSSPPASLPATAGILYIHTNLSKDTKQVWLCNISRDWANITNVENVKHPSIADRFLLLRSDGIPSWLTGGNYAAIQSRREKSRG
jgi:hypothetical protein